jgi:hypothetical protein
LSDVKNVLNQVRPIAASVRFFIKKQVQFLRRETDRIHAPLISGSQTGISLFLSGCFRDLYKEKTCTRQAFLSGRDERI